MSSRVTYLPPAPQPAEMVEAGRVEVDSQGIWLVFRRTVFVMNNPRDVVVHRIARADRAGLPRVQDTPVSVS